tara:strand:- start:11083 stop:11982 length:900 start_codon:yes stop_codon:yes gene_type:complete
MLNQKPPTWKNIANAPPDLKSMALQRALKERGVKKTTGLRYQFIKFLELMPMAPIPIMAASLWLSVDIIIIGANPLVNLLTAFHAARNGATVLISSTSEFDSWPYHFLNDRTFVHFVAKAMNTQLPERPAHNPYITYTHTPEPHELLIEGLRKSLLIADSWPGRIYVLPRNYRLLPTDRINNHNATQKLRAYMLHYTEPPASANSGIIYRQIKQIESTLPSITVHRKADPSYVLAHETILTSYNPLFDCFKSAEGRYPNDVSTTASATKKTSNADEYMRMILEDIVWAGVRFQRPKHST